jgi:hypothetical protein
VVELHIKVNKYYWILSFGEVAVIGVPEDDSVMALFCSIFA